MSEKKTSDTLMMREVFGLTLKELGQEHEDVFVIDGDLHTSTRIVHFKKAFPERFIQVGIAEQNMFGIAAGLAATGFVPFPCTFAVFATRKALDQFALSICFPKLNVKVPGSYAGVPTSKAGPSHNSLADIAITRVLPYLRVAAPGDSNEMRAVMHTAYETEGPVYFRVVRYALPDMFPKNHKFEWGKGNLLKRGSDVTLFGTGLMTSKCIEAATILEKDSISTEVVHLASIKPIDRDLIADSVNRTGCAVTAENASIIGGFGSAVAEVLSETYPVPLSRIGVKDMWIESGGIEDLFTHHEMQPEDIAKAAKEVIKKKENM